MRRNSFRFEFELTGIFQNPSSKDATNATTHEEKLQLLSIRSTAA